MAERDEASLQIWREQAAIATGVADVEVAAPLQRHLTARGTGLPTNFAILLTADEAVAVKFNPRNQMHPLEVAASQFGKEVARWPRGAVSVADVEEGRMAAGLVLRVDGGPEVPCRTPRLDGNPAAAALIEALGGVR
jgi:hypothetical protein